MSHKQEGIQELGELNVAILKENVGKAIHLTMQ